MIFRYSQPREGDRIIILKRADIGLQGVPAEMTFMGRLPRDGRWRHSSGQIMEWYVEYEVGTSGNAVITGTADVHRFVQWKYIDRGPAIPRGAT